MIETIIVFVGILLAVKVIGRFALTLRRVTLLKACDVAREYGAPYDFAADMIAPHNYTLLKASRNELAFNNSAFKMLDVYKQYGMTIAYLYEAKTKSPS